MAFVHASRRDSPVTRPEIDVDQACQLGNRCELCKVVGRNRLPWSRFVCGLCIIGRSPSKVRLDDTCRFIMKKHLNRELELPQNQPLQINLTPSGFRRLQCQLLKGMCIRYTVGMTYDMWQMKEDLNNADPGYILEIKEMHFAPNKYWKFTHWVFVIYTRDGVFVFDPTGIQFGPDWAILQLYQEYSRDKIEVILSINPLGELYRRGRAWPPVDLGVASSKL